MLFNSYIFLLVFFPLVLLGVWLLGGRHPRLAAAWLGLASVVFYGAWDAGAVLLLLGSIIFNYCVGLWITSLRGNRPSWTSWVLGVSIALNLMLLGYYKYSNFFIATGNQLFGLHVALQEIVLPLGISFFTFTQIAFLVDVSRGLVRERHPVDYLLFVTYFPHLIAGPVLHHHQVMPQFAAASTYRFNSTNFAVGLTIFVIGLAKKVVVADELVKTAAPVFSAARDGMPVAFMDAWIGALSYTLQLYFDFSGYSDMAIGLSLMLNVRLPLNFDSPYKATSIIDFWRRWHISLSTFLRDYLYIPLGGGRRGPLRRYVNLMATMVIGGLWHGAGWTFVLWGALHGSYLLINHAWRELTSRPIFRGLAIPAPLGWLLTFLAVVLGWVFFRAENMQAAWSLVSAMTGTSSTALPVQLRIPPLALMVAFALAVFAPNTYQILSAYETYYGSEKTGKPGALGEKTLRIAAFQWKPTPALAALFGVLFAYCLFNLNQVSEFLYFQF